jgi:hypothetical protein
LFDKIDSNYTPLQALQDGFMLYEKFSNATTFYLGKLEENSNGIVHVTGYCYICIIFTNSTRDWLCNNSKIEEICLHNIKIDNGKMKIIKTFNQ